jgi:hypothetical protein
MGNIDWDYTGPMQFDPGAELLKKLQAQDAPWATPDTVPNTPVVPLPVPDPKPDVPILPLPSGGSLDVVSNPTEPQGLTIPTGPAKTPDDSEQKLELGAATIPLISKPTDPGFSAGNGIEGKIGQSNDAAPAPVAETGSSVYGPPMTASEKIENASRQYLEARRHCNQFDMRLAQANLEAVYMSQGYGNKAAKKAAEAKLEQEWKAFSTDHPDACLPESLAPKKG